MPILGRLEMIPIHKALGTGGHKKWSNWGMGRRKGVPGRRDSRNNSTEAENSLVCADVSLGGGIWCGRDQEERHRSVQSTEDTLCQQRRLNPILCSLGLPECFCGGGWKRVVLLGGHLGGCGGWIGIRVPRGRTQSGNAEVASRCWAPGGPEAVGWTGRNSFCDYQPLADIY